MNSQNLIPNSERSPDELREMGRRGGIASGKARRKKAELKKMKGEKMQTSETKKAPPQWATLISTKTILTLLIREVHQVKSIRQRDVLLEKKYG